jgi:hypothetical protein
MTLQVLLTQACLALMVLALIMTGDASGGPERAQPVSAPMPQAEQPGFDRQRPMASRAALGKALVEQPDAAHGTPDPAPIRDAMTSSADTTTVTTTFRASPRLLDLLVGIAAAASADEHQPVGPTSSNPILVGPMTEAGEPLRPATAAYGGRSHAPAGSRTRLAR